MIEIQNLTKDYGQRRALDHIEFSVGKGEVVGFLGPNGAGKSTTMKILTGAISPTSGSVRVAGFDVFESPLEVKKRIGYLPETPPVYADMYVMDYLMYVAALKKVPAPLRKKAVDAALLKTNLGDVKSRLIGHLSKGFRQRVGLAQALVSDPEVLILDEPTVGLDPKQVSEMRELILSLKGHHTLILSTHILSEVEATCDRVIIIHNGKIVAKDSIKALESRGRSKHRLSLRLLTEAIDFKKIQQELPGISEVNRGTSNKEWNLLLDEGEKYVSAVADWVFQNGWGLVELMPSHENLEDVFLKLTYGSDTKASEFVDDLNIQKKKGG